MTKWEYKFIEFDTWGTAGGRVKVDEVEEKLKELGSKGWELGATYSATDLSASRKIIYNFKRVSQF
ncbi:MAG: DUF4177 domain-containing protein [Candidatus Neomarinimicrobiota bacterium]|jgi:hypothetical protein